MSNRDKQIHACATWLFGGTYMAVQHWIAPDGAWKFIAAAFCVSVLHFGVAVISKD